MLLRWLHGLEPPSSLVLPRLRPFARVDARIGGADLAEEDREFLRARLAELRERYAGLEFVLPAGPIHGDASIGNIIRREADGVAVLIDLDGFAWGPREWDLVLTAMYFERFGWHTAQEYREFVAGYGFDVMTWPGYPVLRDIRELIDGGVAGAEHQGEPGDRRGGHASASRTCAAVTGGGTGRRSELGGQAALIHRACPAACSVKSRTAGLPPKRARRWRNSRT